MSAWELTNVVARLLLPPGLLILLILVGLALARSRPRLGIRLATAATLTLFVLSMPIVGSMLLHSLEDPYADPVRDASGGAIVVLGGGLYPGAAEYGGDTVSRYSLERVRYAARLQRRLGKPVLVTGGNPTHADSTEASQMQAAMSEFGVTVQWLEDASDNTFENARYTRRVLLQAHIDKIYLVTHAWHMRRARMAFESAGLAVIPAPTGYSGPLPLRPIEFMPSAGGLERSWLYMHEIAGLAWYRLKSAQLSEPARNISVDQ